MRIGTDRLAPMGLKRTVMPRRRPNGDIRTREYLTETEVAYGYALANRGHVRYTSLSPRFLVGLIGSFIGFKDDVQINLDP